MPLAFFVAVGVKTNLIHSQAPRGVYRVTGDCDDLYRQSRSIPSRERAVAGKSVCDWYTRSVWAVGYELDIGFVESRRPKHRSYEVQKVGVSRTFRDRLAVFCSLILSLSSNIAMAQTTEPLLPVPQPPSGPQAPAAPGQPTYPSQTVTQRPRPEVDPLGLHIGDFFWFPRAELDEVYNSNIFATRRPTISDVITVLQPSFDLLSSFPRNAVNLHGGAASQFYASHSAQNTQDGFISTDGRLDVTVGNSFYGSAQAAHLHIPRTSTNSPSDAAQPVTYWAYTANAGYRQTGLRFGYQADIAVLSTQYNAVPTVGGGILPQRPSDTTISQAVLRGSYELVPDYLGYIRVAGNLTDYPHLAPLNSAGYRTDLGLQILPRHILSGEIYTGYLSQIYGTLGRSITGVDAGGRLVYNFTRLTTATFTGLRTVIPANPTIGTTGTSYLATTAAANVDHELLRNLLLNASAGYEIDTYLGVSRTDNILSIGAGLKYLLHRNLYLGGSYAYQQRNSTVNGGSYTQSVLMVRLSTQF
jgi:hypothetical protein